MAMTIVEAAPGITGGVDTHLDTHVAAALDPLGRLVGTEAFSADAAGYKALFAWLEDFGEVTKIGIEGTSSYGTGLVRFLRRKGVEVVEVNRQNRQSRRNQGKSDPLDAIEAARAAISGRASGSAKSKDGPVEAIRVLVIAKRSARQARVKAITQMRHLGFTAPEHLHCRLKGMTVTALVAVVVGPPRPIPRRRAGRARREDRVVARRHRPRSPRPLRGRARHRCRALGGRR
jgi:transposase